MSERNLLMMVRALSFGMVLLFPESVLAQEGHDHHAGHDMHTMSEGDDEHDMPDRNNLSEMADEHEGHHAAAVTPSPFAIAAPADTEQAAAFPHLHSHGHMDSPHLISVQIERFELHQGDGEKGMAWDGALYMGNAFNKLWLRSEGERMDGMTHHADLRFFGSHAISPWWEATLGLARQYGEGPNRNFLMVGVQGEAQHFLDTYASLYAGASGQLGLAVELEKELLLTNRLILQPRVELRAWLKDDIPRTVGHGLSDFSAGLRLRYEIRREFAPYVGVEWAKKFGETGELVRLAGEDDSALHAVAGFRFWW